MSAHYNRDLPKTQLTGPRSVWTSAKSGLEANQLCLLFPRKIQALALKWALVPRLFLALIGKRPVKDPSKTPFLHSPPCPLPLLRAFQDPDQLAYAVFLTYKCFPTYGVFLVPGATFLQGFTIPQNTQKRAISDSSFLAQFIIHTEGFGVFKKQMKWKRKLRWRVVQDLTHSKHQVCPAYIQRGGTCIHWVPILLSPHSLPPPTIYQRPHLFPTYGVDF